MKRSVIVVISAIFIVLFFGFVFNYVVKNKGITKSNTNDSYSSNEVISSNVDTSNYYSNFVITIDKSSIYKLDNGKMKEFGYVSGGIELELNGVEGEFFLISNMDDNYYIKYNKVDKIDMINSESDRYKNYVAFNMNIRSKGITNFYDVNNNVIFSLNKEFDMPILIKDENRFGVVYQDRLVYVMSNEVDVVENGNNNLINTSGISVLNYHFFYDDSSIEDTTDCNQIICEPISRFKKQLDYIKENNFFTPTMEELEMYIDGKIQLPKSVMITIDDGWRADIGTKILTEYKLNATLFLVTSWYDPNAYRTEYVEVHSHGDNIHDGGLCPGGQGGAIKCMEHDKLLSDLKNSREKLNGSKYFCYPFYEYNDYSISVLKEAGYTMAFGGEYEGGHKSIVPGIDKFRLPRLVIVNYTDMNTFISYLN